MEKQKRIALPVYPSVEKEFRKIKEASGMTWNDFIIQLLGVYKENKK